MVDTAGGVVDLDVLLRGEVGGEDERGQEERATAAARGGGRKGTARRGTSAIALRGNAATALLVRHGVEMALMAHASALSADVERCRSQVQAGQSKPKRLS
jgi:hypothetical protein